MGERKRGKDGVDKKDVPSVALSSRGRSIGTSLCRKCTMRVAAVLFLTLSCLLLLHFGGVRSMSDTYGQNPQHEFGAVWGQVLSPLIPYWTLEGDAFANQDFVRLVPDRQSKRGAMWNTEVRLIEPVTLTTGLKAQISSSSPTDLHLGKPPFPSTSTG